MNRLDVCTETKKKGTGQKKQDYIHISSGVNKENRAGSRVSVAIQKKYRRNIMDREYINEPILGVSLTICNIEVEILAMYTPTDDLIRDVKDYFEENIVGDFNATTWSERKITLWGNLLKRLPRTTEYD